jgi:acetyl-CoA acetyltransferase
LKPQARFVAYATAGCAPEEFGIGPVNESIMEVLNTVTIAHLSEEAHEPAPLVELKTMDRMALTR